MTDIGKKIPTSMPVFEALAYLSFILLLSATG